MWHRDVETTQTHQRFSIPHLGWLATILLACLFIGAVYGALMWTHTFTWTVSDTYDIEVYAFDGTTQGSEITTGLDEEIAEGTVYYWIENEGTTDIRVTLTANWLGDSHGSATATWTEFAGGPPKYVDIAYGGHLIVALTFADISTIPAGSGSYGFTFTSDAQP